MRRTVLSLVILLALTATVYAGAQYKGYPVVNVLVNAWELAFDDVPAVILDGRTMLPVRKVAESMNAIVTWNEQSRSVSILKPEVSVVFTETEDGRTPKGAPLSTFPATPYAKFLSYTSVNNLPGGKYDVFVGLYKRGEKGETIPVELKPSVEITVEKTGTPVMLMTPWDTSILKNSGPAVYYYIMAMKDADGKYQPIMAYALDYTK